MSGDRKVIDGDLWEYLIQSEVGDNYSGWRIEHDERLEDTRWMEVRRMVVSCEAPRLRGMPWVREHWAGTYRLGLTENQENEQYSGEPVTLKRVYPRTREVAITEYVEDLKEGQ